MSENAKVDWNPLRTCSFEEFINLLEEVEREKWCQESDRKVEGSPFLFLPLPYPSWIALCHLCMFQDVRNRNEKPHLAISFTSTFVLFSSLKVSPPDFPLCCLPSAGELQYNTNRYLSHRRNSTKYGSWLCKCRPDRILKILKSQTILCWVFFKQHPNPYVINHVANVPKVYYYTVDTAKLSICIMLRKRKTTFWKASLTQWMLNRAWNYLALVTDYNAVKVFLYKCDMHSCVVHLLF